MEKWPQKISVFRSPRFVPLRYRFIFNSSCLLVLLLGTIALMVGIQQSRSIRRQVERRALAMAQSLAATSKQSLATYNYIALEQSANQAAQDPDTVYVILHDKEGRVAGHSGRPELQGELLQDSASLAAVTSNGALIQWKDYGGAGGVPVLDVAVPVFIPGSDHRWGTVRVALSLEVVYQQIRQTAMTIATLGFLALVVGVLMATWAARRITRPLGYLVHATADAARGNLREDISVDTADEVQVLACNFSVMIREIVQQRRELELQLLEIEHLQRYTQSLITAMKDGLVSVDLNGRLAAINPAGRDLLGLRPQDKAGPSASEVLNHAPELLNLMIESFQGISPQCEISVRGEGEARVLLVGCSPLVDETGRVREVIANLHDVTELKKLEARMRQTERLAALGTLAAGMAHEIRNPLSAIKTFVQLMPRKLHQEGFLEKFGRTVPRELERINRLIEDLLDLARTPKYRFGAVSLEPVLKHSLERFEADLEHRQIMCTLDIVADLPPVWADSEQLMRAFFNLVQNGIHAMPSGGSLCISAYPVTPAEQSWVTGPGDQVCVIFSDTGVGIPPDAIKDIFNPFFTTKDKGTGLGLAITHKVITEHKGRIEAESAVGTGTRFSVLLPIADHSTAQ